MRSTDDLTAAVSAWITRATFQLNHEHLEALNLCLSAPGADVQLVVRLREGAIILEATNAGKRLELYREDVEPLRPADAFGHDNEGSMQ